jgi:hypothetical protein
MNDQIMYQDRLINISADSIFFKNYYYPTLRPRKGCAVFLKPDICLENLSQ